MADRPGHHVGLDYHRMLLGDPVRVDAYERAIRALVRPGDVVLDLGAGTGLLAMLAARQGARVHAVESAAVARLAEQLVRENGLADRVCVHHADIGDLDPVEPVDLVVGDFMGRFLVDDQMLGAVEAAGRWLKPGGRFCPSELRLHLAPAGDFPMPMAELFETPLLGLDLGAALPYALSTCYAGRLGRNALLASEQEYHVLRPPAPAGDFDRELHFVAERPGMLRAIAGWFTADLVPGLPGESGESGGPGGPGVVLSSEPSVDTHWGQYLFPLRATAVLPGDRISVRLRYESAVGDGTVGDRTASDGVWHWSGAVVRGDAALLAFEHDSSQWERERESSADLPPVRGADTIERLLSELRGLEAEDEERTRALHEKLGAAYLTAGRAVPAMQCLLRALDGDLTSREPSLRDLVTAAVHAGRQHDAVRFLAAYQSAFGAHPGMTPGS